MQRLLLLLIAFAAAGCAQIRLDPCSAGILNPNTGVSYSPGCGSAADQNAPVLRSIEAMAGDNGSLFYRLYADTLGSTNAPSICIGNAEAYNPALNTFVPPVSLSLTSVFAWVYVCRPATLLSAWNSQRGSIDISLPAPFGMSTDPAVPSSYRVPLVMLKNNDTGQSSVSLYYTAPTLDAGLDYATITGVTSLGIYAGSGLPRYQINGSNFGDAAASVQLLSAELVTQDALGTVLTAAPVTSAASILYAQGTVIWMAAAQQPQVVESSNALVQFQMPFQPLKTAQGGSNSTVIEPAGVSGLPIPPATRGYLFTNAIGRLWSTPFNFNQ